MKKNYTLQLLIEDGLIQEEEKEIIAYGINRIKTMTISILITLLLGIMMGMFRQSVIFLLVLIPLRKNAGGYHANKQTTCILISFGILVLGLWSIRNMTLSIDNILLITIINFVIIFMLAPIESSNKPLDIIEWKVYRCRTRIMLCIESALLVLMLTFNLRLEANSILIAFVTVSSLLLSGFMKNIFEPRKDNKDK